MHFAFSLTLCYAFRSLCFWISIPSDFNIQFGDEDEEDEDDEEKGSVVTTGDGGGAEARDR